MSLFDKLKLDELNELIHDLAFNKQQTSRSEVAHFCEHDGISIRFTRARTTWQAMAPCALKPWWLFLQPLRKNLEKNTGNNQTLLKDKKTDKTKITKKTQT